MREIKFRAWDKKNERMFYSDDGRGFQFELSPSSGNGIRDIKGNDLPECDFSEWMQYTGLLDKNGKEIYERDIVMMRYGQDEEQNDDGDIIESWEHEEKDIVRYEDGAFIVNAWSSSYDQTSVGWAIEEGWELEVIGNIYENTELLK